MTTRRRLLVFGLLATLTGLGVGVGGWALWPRPGITQENAAKIHVGMTRAEAEAILGGPAQQAKMANAGRNWLHSWIGEEGTARVVFDAYGKDESDEWRVTECTFRRRPDLLTRIRRWLRL